MFSKEKIITAYTIEKCQLCNFEKKRNFKESDFLYKNTVKCSSCEGIMQIEKIFGETIDD